MYVTWGGVVPRRLGRRRCGARRTAGGRRGTPDPDVPSSTSGRPGGYASAADGPPGSDLRRSILWTANHRLSAARCLRSRRVADLGTRRGASLTVTAFWSSVIMAPSSLAVMSLVRFPGASTFILRQEFAPACFLTGQPQDGDDPLDDPWVGDLHWQSLLGACPVDPGSNNGLIDRSPRLRCHPSRPPRWAPPRWTAVLSRDSEARTLAPLGTSATLGLLSGSGVSSGVTPPRSGRGLSNCRSVRAGNVGADTRI
jgi:hypothetical protein